MNTPTSKGMWDLAKGSPSQQAARLPKTYFGHWPWEPPARPAHLTLVTGAKPQASVLSERQQDQPFLRDPGNAGEAPVLSFRPVLEQPSASRINLLPREGPRESQTSFRTAWGKRAINRRRLTLHTLLGHSLAMSWLEPVGNTPQRVPCG